MGEIVNLRRARKTKARDLRERVAEDNRIRFGTPSAIKTLETDRKARATRALEGHRLTPKREGDGREHDATRDPGGETDRS